MHAVLAHLNLENCFGVVKFFFRRKHRTGFSQGFMCEVASVNG